MTIRPLPPPPTDQEGSDGPNPVHQAMHDNTSGLSSLAYFLEGSQQYPAATTSTDQHQAAATWCCPRLLTVQAPFLPWARSGHHQQQHQQQCDSPLELVHEGQVSYDFSTLTSTLTTPTSTQEYIYHCSNPQPTAQSSRRGSNPRSSHQPSSSVVTSPLATASPHNPRQSIKRSCSIDGNDASVRVKKRPRRSNTRRESNNHIIANNKNNNNNKITTIISDSTATLQSPTSPPPKRRRFACPYKVYEPHLSCFLEGRRNQSGGCESIYRLKQHFKRVHKRTFRCERCWKHEETLRGLQDHRATNACQAKELAPTERFMGEEHEAAVDEPLGTRSEEEYWWDMFTMLIPGMAEADPGWMRARYSPYHQDSRNTRAITAQMLPNLGGMDTTLATPGILNDSIFPSTIAVRTPSIDAMFDSTAEPTASLVVLSSLSAETPLFQSFVPPSATNTTTTTSSSTSTTCTTPALTSPAKSLGHSPHLQWIQQQTVGEQPSPTVPSRVPSDFAFAATAAAAADDNEDGNEDVVDAIQHQRRTDDHVEAGRQAAYQRIQGLLIAALARNMSGQARALVSQAVNVLDSVCTGHGG